ncbi:Endochitinase 3 [Cyphellophora attinorum]|uniref:chitinase n=1 Tax=Cyphellophora attinorum TaxID=1664694 RepID=A0A0N0NPA2_9EURO|nr:Endochitinase 3 [Phialophora attinorum]KPI42488.1 Endochitinase 3 [Phialophora attinorum]
MAIPSASAASTAAQNIWDLFLGGGQGNSAVQAARPFGSVVLDGIDLDNETPADATYQPALATALRSLMDASANAGGKQYLLSAAPQCPRPDQSLPIAQMLGVLDYVWVQFFNNPSCNVNAGSGFLASLQAWSNDLAAGAPSAASTITTGGVVNGIIGEPVMQTGTPPRPNKRQDGQDIESRAQMLTPARAPPKLVIGVLATTVGTGNVDPPTLSGILTQVKGLGGLSNLAGVMYWDGSYEELSGQGGAKSYAQVVREVLA